MQDKPQLTDYQLHILRMQNGYFNNRFLTGREYMASLNLESKGLLKPNSCELADAGRAALDDRAGQEAVNE